MPVPAHDRADIVELLHRYSHAIDSGDEETFVDLFVEDGVFTHPEGSYHGRNRLQDVVRDYHRINPHAKHCQHWIGNVVVDLEDDRARVHSYVVVYERDETLVPVPVVMGTYEDEVVATEQGWRFRRRLVTRPSRDELEHAQRRDAMPDHPLSR